MNKFISRAVIIFCAAFMAVAAFAGGSNPGLYYGQVPTAAQWNSYFAAKLDYTPGAANTIPYWDGSGNLLNAAIGGDCASSANVLTCTASHATSLSGGTTGAIPYQSAVGVTAFLSGNTTTTPQFVTSTGTGTAAQAPTLTGSTGSGNVVLASSATLAAATINSSTINSSTINSATLATPTISGISSGVGVTQTISANAAAATTGYSLVFNNTQASAVAGVSVDMGSSAQAHDAFVAKGSNAAAADAFMANMQTGFTGNLFHGSVNSVDQYRVDASGNTIQTGLLTQGDATAPAGQVQLGGMFSTNTASGAGLIIRKSFSSSGNSSALTIIRSRGTSSSPIALVSGDSVAAINAAAFDGFNYLGTAAIQFAVDSTVSTGITPGSISFVTTNSAGSSAQALKIDNAQNVLVTAPSGLGYGTGSGGTVTQATSRTTGVTLNKPSGQITMFTAAGSATPASFTVTNSLVGANDVPTICVKSGATNTYVFMITAVSAGSFVVTFWTTGGTASDTPVLQFNIGKGSIN